MKQISAIPFNRFMELAVLAGHTNDMPFGSDTHICSSQELSYIKFVHAIGVELATGISIEHVLLERIIEIATEHGDYKPYKPDWNTPGATIDSMQLLNSEAQGLFFTRFAYRIAEELKTV